MFEVKFCRYWRFLSNFAVIGVRSQILLLLVFEVKFCCYSCSKSNFAVTGVRDEILLLLVFEVKFCRSKILVFSDTPKISSRPVLRAGDDGQLKKIN